MVNPLLVAGGIGLAGNVVGGLFGKKAQKAQQSAINQANQELAAATERAAELALQGQQEAAAATIEAAKVAADAVLQATGMAVEQRERFFAIADKKLSPFVEQGLFAQDEIASMLGIPNKDGQLVPYNLDKLKQTPGYEFAFNEGQRAVERSAAGTKLSGAQAKAQTQYGQNFATGAFQTQLNNLFQLQGTGANAAASLANAAGAAGGDIARAYTQQGTNLANIATGQGDSLARIATAGAATQASLIDSLATNKANLALASGANRASLYGQQGNMFNNTLGNLAYLYGMGGLGGGNKLPPMYGPVGIQTSRY